MYFCAGRFGPVGVATTPSTACPGHPRGPSDRRRHGPWNWSPPRRIRRDTRRGEPSGSWAPTCRRFRAHFARLPSAARAQERHTAARPWRIPTRDCASCEPPRTFGHALYCGRGTNVAAVFQIVTRAWTRSVRWGAADIRSCGWAGDPEWVPRAGRPVERPEGQHGVGARRAPAHATRFIRCWTTWLRHFPRRRCRSDSRPRGRSGTAGARGSSSGTPRVRRPPCASPPCVDARRGSGGSR